MILLNNNSVFYLVNNSQRVTKEELIDLSSLPHDMFTICFSYLQEKDLRNVKLACRSFYILAQDPNLPVYRWIFASETIHRREKAKTNPLIIYDQEKPFILSKHYVAVMRIYAQSNHLSKAKDCIIEEQKTPSKMKKLLAKTETLWAKFSFLKKKSKETEPVTQIEVEQLSPVKERFVEHLLLALDKTYFSASDNEKKSVCDKVKETCIEGFSKHLDWIEPDIIFCENFSKLLEKVGLVYEEFYADVRLRNLNVSAELMGFSRKQ
ncbi:conserved hypothetical protein [Candidatus Protochlamydia naegleriophila]|uniref:F-box domain-containing protein n=1 Tax=Candidatus Protochlamydia naegleriophila TaxID=389348 RepID=A0A0U5ERY0_9BACT|nr:F-box protein [Candidatus Protochlamydia naegleriophila]CUI16881.1 conserved hypothetical protein [Candidatus Protochlamydia naegleriophila]